MNTKMKRVTADEKGAALILTLVLLVVASLVIPSLLGFMYGGLRQGEVHQRRGAELYAADAGVEKALWQIASGNTGTCSAAPDGSPNHLDVNGNNVTFVIRYRSDDEGVSYYKILSTAHGDTSATTIEAYAVNVFGNYTDITNNVLTSQDGINYPNNEDQYSLGYPEGNGPVEYYDGPWPDAHEDLVPWYWNDVKDGQKHYGDLTIDLDGKNLELPGSLYVDGNLTITDKKKNVNSTLTLGGTIYATGRIFIDNADITVDMNNHAFFTTSEIEKPTCAFYVKTSQGNPVIFKGPGVIAARGDIWFEPKMDADDTEPIFIISVHGETVLKPNGAFYGAIAGSVTIDLQPGSSVTYPDDGFPDDLNWPGFSATKYRYALASWTVSTS